MKALISDSSDLFVRPEISKKLAGVLVVITPLDLFREETDGTVLWLGTVSDVEAGKKKAMELMAFTPGRYFVFSQTTRHKLYITQENSKKQW